MMKYGALRPALVLFVDTSPVQPPKQPPLPQVDVPLVNLDPPRLYPLPKVRLTPSIVGASDDER